MTKTAPLDAPATEDPISAIRNLGPATEAAFIAIGITTASQLRAIGADEAYRRLLLAGHRPHFIAYYVMVMGLQDRAWNAAKGAEKDALRAAFDAIKASVVGTKEKGRSDLEAALQFFGVVEKRR